MSRGLSCIIMVIAGCTLAALVAGPVAHAVGDEEAEHGWVPLFDGRSLAGWVQRNGTATYRVHDGTIVGRTSEGSPNSFLCTTREYDDFELTFEVKVDDELNSGVQIRSQSHPGRDRGRVHGPQVEISTDGMAGFVYGEALGTDWLSADRDNAEAQAAFKRGEWNRYRVLAHGKSIETWVNDVPVTRLIDERSGMLSGFIALQVHGIPRGAGPYEVRWRNLRIRDLSEHPRAAPLRLDAERISFRKLRLTDKFYSEGASFGDFNDDGNGDVVAGPFWYQGPDFATRHAIYEPTEYDINGYSNNFFAFTRDMNGDGRVDVLFIGFPGESAWWHENPGPAGGHWPRHQVFNVVDNESPTFTQLVGDERPELVFHTQGFHGYASPDWEHPASPWSFHRTTGQIAGQRYTHGLGVGDVNGDGRLDVLLHTGWLEQPEDPRSMWRVHEYPFAEAAAQMYAYDFDRDGDNDVVTSLHAHQYGIAWYEQVRDERGGIDFRRHLITGRQPGDTEFGLTFTQPHAMALADIDGDGVDDLVTGKRFWAHNGGDPDERLPAVLYWFQAVPTGPGEVRFVPHLIDDDSGVGTQVTVGDINGDGRPDIVVGNKKGAFVFLHSGGQ